MTRWTWTVSVLVFAIAAAASADIAAQSKPLPSLADVATHARVAVVAFSDAVVAGDSAPFVARFTPEARAVFNPQRFKSLFGQFFDQKLSFPHARTAPFHFIGLPRYGVTGSLESKGFFIQDKAKDNLILFEVSWRISNAVWTMDGFGAKAFPKEGLPTNAQLDELLSVVVAFNTALEQGDFGPVHTLLHTDLQASMTPEAMKQHFARFVRDKMYARALTKDQLLFTEEPLIFDGSYLVLKTSAPVPAGNLMVTLMCVKAKETGAWKVKDLRAFVE